MDRRLRMTRRPVRVPSPSRARRRLLPWASIDCNCPEGSDPARSPRRAAPVRVRARPGPVQCRRAATGPVRSWRRSRARRRHGAVRRVALKRAVARLWIRPAPADRTRRRALRVAARHRAAHAGLRRPAHRLVRHAAGGSPPHVAVSRSRPRLPDLRGRCLRRLAPCSTSPRRPQRGSKKR